MQLSKNFVDTLVGDVSITVPEDFDGIYTLHTNNTGEVLGFLRQIKLRIASLKLMVIVR